MRFCPHCSNIVNDDEAYCPSCQMPLEERQVSLPEFSMRWFKFLIYFSLFAGALVNLANGVNYITGNVYYSQGADPELVYRFWGEGLKTVDVIYGVILIAVAALCIVSRFLLAKFKSSGVLCLYAVLAINAIIPVIYYFMLISTTGLSIDFGDVLPGIIASVIMLFINIIYFSKRSRLFVN